MSSKIQDIEKDKEQKGIHELTAKIESLNKQLQER